MRKDLVAGLMLFAMSAALFWQSMELPTGTASEMEAGFVPQILSGALAILSLVLAGTGLMRDAPRLGHLGLRQIGMVTLAVLVFAGLLQTVGVIAATVALTVIGSLAGPDFRVKEVAGVAVFLCLLVLGLFVYLLELPIKV